MLDLFYNSIIYIYIYCFVAPVLKRKTNFNKMQNGRENEKIKRRQKIVFVNMSDGPFDLRSALDYYKRNNVSVTPRYGKVEEIQAGNRDLESLNQSMNQKIVRYSGESMYAVHNIRVLVMEMA